MSEPVTLSSFELQEPVAEGGMGVVYRAVHRETEVPVAVKIQAEATNERRLRRFREEVQAHAGLHHPGIVHLFEYGTVDREAAARAGRDIRAGSPYVAMEYAERGALRDWGPVSDWRTLRSILVQVLDGLAHAHARGVIHRDLKPENLLVFESPDTASAPLLKLADFGIAHALDPEDGDAELQTSRVGTLAYMSPEQLRADWRQYGPWTDLYALGCFTWELVCRRPPFEADTREALAVCHESAPRPELDPAYPVPEALERWIHRVMAVDPEQRFQRAADAAWALPAETLVPDDRQLEPRGADPTDDSPSDRRSPTLSKTGLVAGPSGSDGAVTTVDVDEPPTADETDSFDPEKPAELPPIPQSWRRERRGPLPSLLVGTGLGLFGLRETPFVDRDAEREHVWERLREVDRTGEARVVLVVGDSGTGKTRLVEWMARRAHELGAARILRAVHTPGGVDPTEGMSAMVRRLVHGHDLDRGAFHEHLLERLPALDDAAVDREVDARALTELVAPTEEGAELVDGPRYRFAAPSQKVGLLARTIRRFGQRRLPFLWLDDLQWGPLAANLVSHLLETPLESPAAAVVATVRADILAEEPALRERVDTWTSHDRCTRLDLDALDSADHRAFIDEMLPLEEELAERLADRTEGNPLFATQLLRDLVEGRRLRSGERGFAVPEGVSLGLPADVHELWIRRIRRWSDDLGRGDAETLRRAVEWAAALGREVDEEEWREVCRRLAVDRPDDLRAGLVERGLADRADNGWAFAHGFLVESLGRHAREHDRWRDHHRQCVELLEELYPDRPEQTAARRADHWIEAGELERALEPLLEEVERLKRLGEYERARSVLERREALVDALDLPDSDARVVENDIHLAPLEVKFGASPDEGLEVLEEAIERARRGDHHRLLAEAWYTTAAVRLRAGNQETSREAAVRAARRAEDCEEPTVRIKALEDWAWAETWSGDPEAAEEPVSEAIALAEEIGDHYRLVEAQRCRAWAEMSQGDRDRAAERFEWCLEECREAGYRAGEMRNLNGLGEIARFDGDADEARRRYRRHEQLGRELGLPTQMAVARSNLFQVELMDGAFDAAAERLRETEQWYERLSRKDEIADLLKLGHLTRAAGVEEWSRFDDLLADYDDGWPAEARLLKDHPWLAEMAGDYAAEAGEGERAKRVWKLARDLWERIGDAEAHERVAIKIKT